MQIYSFFGSFKNYESHFLLKSILFLVFSLIALSLYLYLNKLPLKIEYNREVSESIMSDVTSTISNVLTNWYSSNKRQLPWRETTNPYNIWLSEVILQQTRVVQGYDYYVRFVEHFPTIDSLAQADEDIVMKLWQGLGYYSRARNLHQAAKTISTVYDGKFPTDYISILKLKGVGEYTAAAIASFAYGQPYAVVDGNVYRVLSRLFAIETPIDSTTGKKEFKELATELLDKKNPGLHNQAIMEFGALQCTPISPDCINCPLSYQCLAYSKKLVTEYPVKQGKTKIKERFFYYFDIRCGPFSYIKKRTENDIWKNLYELPLIELDEGLSFEELSETSSFKQLFEKSGHVLIEPNRVFLKHILSHRHILASFYKAEITDDSSLKENYKKIKTEDLSTFAVSRLVDKYFETSSDLDLFSRMN